MIKINNRLLLLCLFVSILTASIIAQDVSPTPHPTPPADDEPIKIFTEEVQLNVIAQSTYTGEKVPNLKEDDLLVVESGDPQTITSIKQFPASVLILMDTGQVVSFGKNNTLTRLTAKVLVKNLSDEDSISILQYYDKIETVSDWTKNKTSIFENLDKKMFLGKRSRFVDALNESVEKFKSRPLENRNLVLISDGLETVRGEDEFQKAIRKVLEANISVHIISYTNLQVIGSVPKTKAFKVYGDINGIASLNLDREMIKFYEKKRGELAESEKRLEKLATETGGEFHAPESPDHMIKFADDVARAIGSQYVITYIPTKSFNESDIGKERKVRVSTYRNGIRIRARETLFIGENETEEN